MTPNRRQPNRRQFHLQQCLQRQCLQRQFFKRRDFIRWMSAGAIAASLPVAIAACTPKPKSADDSSQSPGDTPLQSPGDTPLQSPGDTPAPAGRFTTIGSVDELNQKGYLSSDEALSKPVIVIQDPNNLEAVIALASTCTHQGCTIAWQEDLFACPCHGSKFNPDGSVVIGPAEQALEIFIAKVEEGSALVAETCGRKP